MSTEKKATAYFADGMNCSQAVFTAIVEEEGLEREQAIRIASGFGGGIARMQKTCGAVTGAIMAIGYLDQTSFANPGEQKEHVYDKIQRFVRLFTEKHGTIECGELLGCSLNTQDDRQKAKELGLFEKVCANCVRDAVSIVEEIGKKQTGSIRNDIPNLGQ